MPTLTRDLMLDIVGYGGLWLEHQRRTRRIPGIQAAISFEGEVLLSGAYGLANIERQVPMRADHLFRVASHSKMFTAIAIMQLREAGKLRLDDRVGQHVGWLNAPGLAAISGLTLRELLSHGSGVIRDGTDGDHWQLRSPFPGDAELRDLLGSGAAVYPANHRFKYSNMAYALLGLVIAEAAGVSYNRYVITEIVERLGLRRTGPDHEPSRGDDYVTGYTREEDGERTPISQISTRSVSAAAGFFATAEDLCTFGDAHCLGDDRLITDASKRQMQHPEWTIEGEKHRYGLGLDIFDVGDMRVVGHGGGWPGQSTRTLFTPARRVSVSVLVNGIEGPATVLALEVIKLIEYASNLEQPADPPAVDPGRFCGRFMNLWGTTDIARFGNRLVAVYPNGASPVEGLAELEIESDDVLRVTRANGYDSPGEPITFTWAPDGAVECIRAGSAMLSHPPDRFHREFLATDEVRLP